MDLFRKWFCASKCRKPRARQNTPQLRLESLEGRVVPAIIVDQGLNEKPNADFETIQEAIDAANPGDVIRVFDGTYAETLDVNKDNLKIINKSGTSTVIKPTAINPDEAIVDITANNVLFKRFNIDGSALTDPAGASDFDSAIRVSGGGSATIRENNISGLFDADGYVSPNGFGIHVGDPGNGNGTAKVILNNVSDYFKSGILVEADAGGTSRGVIRHNTVTGVGFTNDIDQHGIDIFGANGVVEVRARGNTVTGNDFGDPQGFFLTASGVLLNNVGSDDWVLVNRNTISENQTGIAVDLSDGPDIRLFHNSVTNNVQDGILLLDSNEIKIIGNNVNNNGQILTTNDVTVDFAGFAAGTVITDQLSGITVEAIGGSDDAMIFDTNNPTGGDSDLGFTDQGNALIVSEDGDTSDPDDNAGGGDLKFTFDSEVTVNQLTLLDIDTNETAKVKAYDKHGNLIKIVDASSLGDNTVETLDINAEGVKTLIVWLSGSGAVSSLDYTEVVAEEGIGGGITLFDSSNNLIKGNGASENGLEGIFIFGGSGNIVKFDATNDNFTDGIALYFTTGNTVEANEVSGNGNNGISLIDADNNTVRFNFSLENNGNVGIEVDADSTGNILEDNAVFGDNDVVAGVAGTSVEADTAEAVVLTEVDALEEDYVDSE